MVMISISPLAVSKTDFPERAKAVIEEAADYAHIDVMDGKFVENKTFSPETVRALKLSVPKDLHLMVEHPEDVWEEYVDENTERVAFHIEACKDPLPLIGKIQDKGLKVGLVLNPETGVSALEPYLSHIDFVLIMFVHPGASGQKFIPDVIDHLRALRGIGPDIEIEVDGGVDEKTAPLLVEAGADILVSSSYVYDHEDPLVAVDILRNS